MTRWVAARARSGMGAVLLCVLVFATAGPSIGAKSVAAKDERVETLLVAAASDLRPAFEKIGVAFTKQTGTKVTFSFGSSGQLAQQIINGAPFDVFASADVGFVDEVVAAGRGDRATKSTYAFGRLAVWTPKTTPSITAVRSLAAARFKRIAIANPDHAPYGVAAVQALTSAKVFNKVKNRLVYGENVSDTYRLVTSGNADAAVVSLSLVIADAKGGRFFVVPVDAHRPLQQTLVITAPAKRSNAAKAFAELVASPAGRSTMRAYGFLLPGDTLPAAVSQ